MGSLELEDDEQAKGPQTIHAALLVERSLETLRTQVRTAEKPSESAGDILVGCMSNHSRP